MVCLSFWLLCRDFSLVPIQVQEDCVGLVNHLIEGIHHLFSLLVQMLDKGFML